LEEALDLSSDRILNERTRLHVNVTAEEQEMQERLVLTHDYGQLGNGAK